MEIRGRLIAHAPDSVTHSYHRAGDIYQTSCGFECTDWRVSIARSFAVVDCPDCVAVLSKKIPVKPLQSA